MAPDLAQVGLAWALLSGMLVTLCFYLSSKNGKEGISWYRWALAFLIAGWSGMEWALWQDGYDMFALMLKPIMPLNLFFAIFIGFAIWRGEELKARKTWQVWMAILAAIFVVGYLTNTVLKW